VTCPDCEYDWAGFPICSTSCGRTECYQCSRHRRWTVDPVAAAEMDYLDALEYAEKAEEIDDPDARAYRRAAEFAYRVWHQTLRVVASQGPEGRA
jgi:hypothetical protein